MLPALARSRTGAAPRRVGLAHRLLSSTGARRTLHSHIFSVLGHDENRVLDTLRDQLDLAARRPVPAGGWTMLYAIDKHLPPPHLQEFVRLLRSFDGLQSVRARVGALTGSWPPSALPDPLRGGAESSPMSCVSVALLPASEFVAFQSKVKGKRAISVGRWQPLDVQRQWSSAPPADQQNELWSKTNPETSLPPALAPYADVSGPNGPPRVAATLALSDSAPQGLIEGLVHHFPSSSHLGLFAPPTPFETGRDHTLFYDGPGVNGEPVHEIFDQGAVGVAILSPSGAGGDASASFAVDLETAYANLHLMGSRHTLTSAEGNVISSLDGENAVEQFRKAVEARPIRRPDHECVFRIGVYLRDQTMPDVMATIVGGQSSRGALLLNTDASLGEMLLKVKAPGRPTVQFFQEDPHPDATPGPQAPREAADAAGTGKSTPDEALFLFVNPGGGGDGRPKPKTSSGQAITWPGTFAAASEEGWFQAHATKVPGSAAWMSLGDLRK